MLNIISNLDENAKLESICGFNQVVAWFLHDAFERIEYPSRMVCDREDNPPIADNTLVISNRAMLKMRAQSSIYRTKVRESTKSKLALYLDSDMCVGYPYDVTFTVIPPITEGKYVYAGWGADISYCYPDQEKKAVFLDRQGKTGDLSRQREIYQTYLRVLLPRGKGIFRYDQLFLPKGVPWIRAQPIFRKCHYYCCTQYGESNLSRIDAATCGNLLVIPKYLYPSMRRTVDSLSHKVWETERDLEEILETETDPKQIQERASKHSWREVAERIRSCLEG